MNVETAWTQSYTCIFCNCELNNSYDGTFATFVLLSKFLVRYQQFASHAYCGAAEPVSKMASQQEKAFCVYSVWGACATSSFKPCTKLTLHCIRGSGHLKTEHTESLFLLRCYNGNWSRGPAVSMRSELLVAHEKLGQFSVAGGVHCVRDRWERNFLLTFKTAPFFCIYPVHIYNILSNLKHIQSHLSQKVLDPLL
jgi:hypothetical protein